MLSSVLGKAENYLKELDSAAAKTLSNGGSMDKHGVQDAYVGDVEHVDEGHDVIEEYSSPSFSSHPRKVSVESSSLGAPQVEEKDLLDFLNDPSTPPTPTKGLENPILKKNPLEKPPLKRQEPPSSPAVKQMLRDLRSQLQEAHVDKSRLEETLDASLHQVKQLQAEILTKDKKLTKLRQAEQAHDDRLQKLSSNSSSALSQVEALRRDVVASETTIRELRAALSAAEQEAQEAMSSANARVAAAHRRAEEAETALEKERSSARDQASVAERRADEAATALSEMSTQMAALQRTLETKVRLTADLQGELAKVQLDLEAVSVEFEQYKVEARSVLSQTQGEGAGERAEEDQEDVMAVRAELNAAIVQQAELQTGLREALSAVTMAERAQHHEKAVADAAIAEMQQALDAARSEAHALRAELDAVKDASREQDLALRSEVGRLLERVTEAEAQAARSPAPQAAQPHDSVLRAERDELENRLRAMTEHLIGKSNQLETLNSERAHLQLKLEQEQQLRQDLEREQRSVRASMMDVAGTHAQPMASLLKRRDGHVIVDLDDSSKLGTPSKRPRDATGFVRKNVISAANAIDSASTVAGRFLSLSPLARLVLLLYVFVLHAWVAYIMMHVQNEQLAMPNATPRGDTGLPVLRG